MMSPAGRGPRIVSRHPSYPAPFVRRVTAWVAGRLGMPARFLQALTVEVRYCRNHAGRGRWCGRYRHKIRTVTVALPKGPITYPQSLAHNREEREAGWEAADEIDLFVAVLAHELEHARVVVVAENVDELRRLNHEPTVRARAWSVMRLYREAAGASFEIAKEIVSRSGGVSVRPSP